MENQEAIYFLITVSLVLGIGNAYYLARHLIRTGCMRTGFPKIARKPKKEADESNKIKD